MDNSLNTPRPYNFAIGYLRGFATLIVLAHHAVLAYHPFAPPISADMVTHRWWQAFPVVDDLRSELVSLFVIFNDTFVMALFFLISGLFVWRSLERKGSSAFMKSRAMRLGVPFLVVAIIIAPLAYYPAYLGSGAEPGLSGFWSMWSQLGNWPAGPAWFLWLLLAFGSIAAGIHKWQPEWGRGLGNLVGRLQRPQTFFVTLFGVSALAYLSLAIGFGPDHWSAFGPFSFQSSRLLHYLVYFTFGVGFGAYGLERTLLSSTGALSRSWRALSVVAILSFFAFLIVIEKWSTATSGSAAWGMGAAVMYTMFCAAVVVFFLAVFLRFARSRAHIWDSLDRNAYGMYLIHYPFASWIPFVLLDVPLPAIVKAMISVVATVALSWITVILLRQITPVARVI